MEDDVVEIAVGEEAAKARDPEEDQPRDDHLWIGRSHREQARDQEEVHPGAKLQ